jgi:hypothetical protein
LFVVILFNSVFFSFCAERSACILVSSVRANIVWLIKMDCASAKFLSYSGINKKLLDYSETISLEDE